MRFQKMMGFELRGVIYGDPLDTDKPFIDLRRYGDRYTINAIYHGVEAEIDIGKRWFRKDIPSYVDMGLKRLDFVTKKIKADNKYKESIRIRGLFQ